jgi:murein DD-endopeptidase MepM/ murein hydrolase activator NlpD
MFVSGVGSMPKSPISVAKPWFTRSARLALVACAAGGMAACSSSVERFADYPPVNTNSVSPSAAAVSSESVQGRPLDQGPLPSARPAWQGYSAPAAQPPRPVWQGSPAPATQPPRPVWQGYSGPPQGATPAPAAAVIHDPAPVHGSAGTWSGRVTVHRGQTLYSIARTYKVTVGELARANNITTRHAVRIGETLHVPGQGGGAQDDETRYQAASAPAPRPSHGESTGHTVRSGETLFSIGRTYNISPYAIAEANNLPRNYSVKTGEQLQIPGGAHHVARNDAAPVEHTAFRQKPEQQQAPQEAEPQIAEEPAADAPAADQSDDASAAAEDAPAAEQQAPASGPEPAADAGFRWPVRGKVIATFGQKPNGTRNEGINIAVPEGTSVRAAESGVVAYAGNELKGYGNLVLLRHENGWVTAYAHNKDLFVRRGDTVKRGDVIAKAGQTGSVTSPQVHFELRKGATAVDPVKYLSSATAAN